MNRSITKITEEMGPVGNKGHEIFFCPDIKCCEPFNIAIQVQALQEGGGNTIEFLIENESA